MHLASSHRIEKRIVEERKTHEIGASRKERARIRGGRNTHPQNTNQAREFPQLPRECPRLQRKGNHLRPAAYDRGGCKTQTSSVFFVWMGSNMCARECVFWVNWSLVFLRVPFSFSRVCGCPFFVFVVILSRASFLSMSFIFLLPACSS